MQTNELKSKIETLVTEAKSSGNEKITFWLTSIEIGEFVKLLEENNLVEKEKVSYTLAIEQAEKLIAVLDESEEPENTDTKDQKPSDELKEERTISPFAEKIAEDLKHRRQKAAPGSDAYGKKLPQVKVEASDVQGALDTVKGVTDDYLLQFGFLTHVYRNASARTNTDITKIETGLFIKFV